MPTLTPLVLMLVMEKLAPVLLLLLLLLLELELLPLLLLELDRILRAVCPDTRPLPKYPTAAVPPVVKTTPRRRVVVEKERKASTPPPTMTPTLTMTTTTTTAAPLLGWRAITPRAVCFSPRFSVEWLKAGLSFHATFKP